MPDLADLADLQAAVSQSASLDFAAIEMDPAGCPKGSEPAYRDVLSLTGFVFELDSGEHAAARYDTFLDTGVSR